MNIKGWKIYPDFIPHSDFHKGYWLNINEPNPWYYFFPTIRTYTLPTDSNFYKTLDSDLKKTVILLHQNKIPTTPSCSGHFFSPEHYARIYERLKNNARKIAVEGVILENPETGAKYFYKNAEYKLPWSSEYFVDKSLDYQKTGVLGFVDPNQDLAKIVPLEFRIKQDGDITIMLEISENEEKRKLKWNKLCKVLSRYL